MTYLIIGYLFMLIFRPFEYWPQLGELHLQRAYMLVLLAAAFFYRDKRFRLDTIHVWLLAFVLSLLLSTMLAVDIPLAWETTLKYLKIVVFYLVLVMTMHDARRMEQVTKAFLVIMALYVGKSAWEFFLHGRYVYRMGIKRMVGVDVTYGMPNAFAATICYSLPVVWAMLGKGLIKRWIRLAVLGYALLAPVCIVMTGSRSGMLTALAFVAMVAWKAKRKAGMAVLSVFLLLAGWQFVPDLQQRRFMSIFTPEVGPEASAAQNSAQGRLEGLIHGAKLLAANPLSGVGPNNTRRTWYGGDGPQPHNLYGQVMGELGLFGLVTFFGFVAALWRRLRINAQQARKRLAEAEDPAGRRDLLLVARLASAGCMILVLMLFSGNFGHILFRYQWLLVAYFAVVGQAHLSAQRAGALESAPAGAQQSMEYA